jgi:hypothetical protein
LDLEKNLMVVGYIHIWNLLKEDGKFTIKHKSKGLGSKLKNELHIIMPK